MQDKNGKGMLFSSFINIDLWNKAKWKAVFFMTNGNDIPYIGLAFENENEAKKIFNGWINRMGNEDKYDELRISIIEGDIPGEEYGYSVHINSGIGNIIKKAQDNNVEIPKELALTIGRFHRMNPDPTSINLERFKTDYFKFKEYNLIPGVIKNNKLKTIDGISIKKKEIFFRDSKEITATDLDSVVFKNRC